MASSKKARELQTLARKRRFNENLRDYLYVLENDDQIEKVINFINENEKLTKKDIYNMVDSLCPPEHIVITDDDKKIQLDDDDKLLIQGLKAMGIDYNAIPYMVVTLKRCNKVSAMIDYLVDNRFATQDEVMHEMVNMVGNIETYYMDSDMLEFIDNLDRMIAFDIKYENDKMILYGRVREGRDRTTFEYEVTKDDIKNFIDGVDTILNDGYVKDDPLLFDLDDAELGVTPLYLCNEEELGADYCMCLYFYGGGISADVFLTKDEVLKMQDYLKCFIK